MADTLAITIEHVVRKPSTAIPILQSKTYKKFEKRHNKQFAANFTAHKKSGHAQAKKYTKRAHDFPSSQHKGRPIVKRAAAIVAASPRAALSALSDNSAGSFVCTGRLPQQAKLSRTPKNTLIDRKLGVKKRPTYDPKASLAANGALPWRKKNKPVATKN
jgi:hypothetical protein